MTVRRVALEALDVRAAALDILGAGVADGSPRWHRAATASVPAWELCLRTERCAAPTADAIGRMGLLDALPPGVRRLLERRRRAEGVRALRARAQLAEVGTEAARRGWRVLVLKGGVPLARGSGWQLDLADLDLLAAEHDIGELSAWLDASASGHGRYTSPRHGTARYRVGALPVEVHHTTELDGAATPARVWEDAVFLRDGLLGLEPPEHLWFTLYHATASHLSRRGRIRDVLLLADAVRSCGRADFAAIERRIASDPLRGPLRSFLEMGVAQARALPIVDRFEQAAFTRYVMYELFRRAGPRRTALEGHQLIEWVCAARAGREERQQLWARALSRSSGPSSHRVIAAVERRSPRLGYVWRVALRLVHRSLIWSAALPLALWIGWAEPRWARRGALS